MVPETPPHLKSCWTGMHLCLASFQINSSRHNSTRFGLHVVVRGAGERSGDVWRLSWGGVRACVADARGDAALASDELPCVGLHVSHPKPIDRCIKLEEITKANRCPEKGVISEH